MPYDTFTLTRRGELAAALYVALENGLPHDKSIMGSASFECALRLAEVWTTDPARLLSLLNTDDL